MRYFNKYRTLLWSIFSLAICCIVIGCENPVPQDYIEEIVAEGFVVTGQPLTNIRVYRTMSLQDTFSMKEAVLPDAEVIIKENGTQIPVRFQLDTAGGFFTSADETYRVKANSTYTLEVRARGKVLTATTQTMPEFSWIKTPRDTLQYPGEANETKPQDSLNISWQATPGMDFYVIGVECIDTTNYGAFLIPQTTDTNRRIREDDLFDTGSRITPERTRFGFSLASSTPVVWLAFKWFGKHNLTVYAGDKAFRDWYRMVGGGRRSNYDYRLSNMQGGLGVWAGATSVTAPTFLVKDKKDF